MAEAEISFSRRPPHLRHFVMGLSDIFCITSVCALHLRHSYSYKGIRNLQFVSSIFCLKRIIRIVQRARNYYEHLMRASKRCLRPHYKHRKIFRLDYKIFVPIRYEGTRFTVKNISHDERILFETYYSRDLRSNELSTYKINTLPNLFRPLQ